MWRSTPVRGSFVVADESGRRRVIVSRVSNARVEPVRMSSKQADTQGQPQDDPQGAPQDDPRRDNTTTPRVDPPPRRKKEPSGPPEGYPQDEPGKPAHEPPRRGR